MIAAEWIRAALPRSWGVVRLRDHATVINGYPFDSELFSADTGMPLVRIRDIASQDTEVRYAGDVVPEALLTGGEILVGMDGDFNVARWKGAGALLNQRVCSVRPATTVDPRFLYYVLPAPLALINEFTYSTTVKHLSSFDVLKIRIPFPPLPQQRAIADYLDRETARLDALVAAKERVLGLLAEKRRALITRAVTRGLDPRAPLRDSGIPWLGEIPAHWEVKRLKHVLKAQKGAIKTGPFGSQLHLSEMNQGEIKVYNQKTVIVRDIAGGEDYISREKFDDLSGFEIFPGDLLVTTRGTIGRCMVVPTHAEKGILHPCLMRIQLDESLALNDYIEMLIEDSGQVLDQLRIVSNATTIDVIYSESLKEVWLAIPIISEQRAIVEHIARRTANLDNVRAATVRTIALLKERRAGLIAAAVTGQIDIRGAVA